MKIIHTSLHQIDHFTDTISEIDVSNQSKDLSDYVNRLLDEITNSSNKRKFNFDSETTEVRISIKYFLEGKYDEAININTKRLLKIEKIAQDEIEKLGVEIQKGSLFQAFLKNEESQIIVISKADHSEYLDEDDLKKHKGLPWKKKIFKAFVAEINLDGLIERVFVYDTNSPMAKYWWRNYLELTEFYTDTHNTKTVLNILDKKIFSKIKKEFPADHMILRNSSVKYFRSKEDFNITEYVDSLFENYKSVDPNFKTNKIRETVESLPDKWNFDSSFKIEKKEIKQRLITSVQLDTRIELILNDHIDNLQDIIIAETDNQEKKYIKIYSDTGYETFKRNK